MPGDLVIFGVSVNTKFGLLPWVGVMLLSLSNLPYWILLGTGIALFLGVIATGGGDDDFELDTPADVEFGIETDTDLVDGATEVGGIASTLYLLSWLGFGRTPLILLLAMDLTLWGFFGWVINSAIAPNRPFPGAVFLSSLGLAMLVGSLLSRPIGRIFASFGEDVSSDRLVGCLGTVTSAFIPFESSGKIGQVDVVDPAGNRVSISSKLPDWATITLRHNAQVLVIERSRGYYLVVAQDSPDQAHWLNPPSHS